MSSFFQLFIQLIKIDVRQEWRQRASLHQTYGRVYDTVSSIYSRLQHPVDKGYDPRISYTG